MFLDLAVTFKQTPCFPLYGGINISPFILQRSITRIRTVIISYDSLVIFLITTVLFLELALLTKTETSFCDWFFTGDIFIIERWQIAGNLSR